jgi:hypothetical protein
MDDLIEGGPLGGDKADGEVAESRVRDRALAKNILRKIKQDKLHHAKAMKRMARDMLVATHGRDETWDETLYTANIVGRHVKQKTASLYAKNPTAVARRREMLDFAVWDENPDTLMMAFQTVQAMQAMAMQPQIDPMSGMPMAPQMPPEAMQAQAVLDDFMQGHERRDQIKKIGKTLEILFAHAMRDQKPVDFKTAMKQMVRRACTTGVGYVEIGFHRELGQAQEITAQLTDARARLDHLRRLAEEIAEGEIGIDDAEMAELERAVADLTAQPEIVLREGLVFDFPQSTKVIPDRMCKTLVGFIGARHLTVEYLFTRDEVQEMFGVDLASAYTPYQPDGTSTGTSNLVVGAEESSAPDDVTTDSEQDGLVCVWKHYDKPSGLVYYVADGHPSFLREPAAPDVFVEDFWPVYALTFNEVENEKELFPPSDVTLLLDMQKEYNRARQGMREHRDAARPRWAYPNGGLEAEDIAKLQAADAFSVVPINLGPGEKISDKLQSIPVPGVDPNLYETGQLFTDMQLVGGSQEANYGGVAKATATESAIAANSTASSDSTSIDDLDAFLTVVSRASGQVLIREMSTQKVMEIVGPGAIWPEGMTLSDIAAEMFLEIEAGSSGKPNQAVAVKNWSQLLPMLLQMPNINTMWLARETLKRLDDKLDLTEAIAAGIPSIMMQNSATQIGPTAPGAGDPNQQGPQGANNGPAPPPERQAGSDPAFGSNQV